MPTLTITTSGPLKATIEIGGTTIREPEVQDLGDDQVSVELGGASTAAILIGRRDTIRALLDEASQALNQ